MYVMNYDIRIGEYKLKTLDSVKIEKSVENLSDKATIVIPGTYINRTLEVEDKIKEGDRVLIRFGYDNNLATEFQGYLNSVSTDNSTIKIECEDATFLFKKPLSDKEHKEISLKDLLGKVIDEINTLNTLSGTATDYKLSCDFSFSYSKFTIFKANGMDVLKKVQEDTKSNIYFEGDTLHVHAQYSYIPNSEPVIFDFSHNIEKSDLKYVKLKDKKIEIEVHYTDASGKTKTEKYGQSGGEKRTRYVNTDDTTSLKKAAENEYNLWSYDGYEGSLTGWLIPYVEPSYQIMLRDSEQLQKQGIYYVLGTETSFSSSGGERKIKIGRRLG
ncbi:MAG: hypothetical protein LBG80_04690 [Bacteroidales bacterium]|jgi:hypothetical protein|nr:hypothetical protein [Bacteroidales bacterium]